MSKPKSKEYTIPLVRVQLVRDSGVAAPVNKIMSPQDTFEIARQRLEFSDREVFLVIHVATDMAVISIEAAHIGTLDTGITSPREIFKGAILANAAAVIFAHNHPSGDPTPSPDDVNTTRELVKAGEILDIPVLDHVIIGAGRYISMAERKLL